MLLALLLAASTAPAPGAPSAQRPPALPLVADPTVAEALGRFEPTPGAWVEYSIVPRKGPRARLRLSVLTPALGGGRYWLEAATQPQNGPPVAIRMLLHGPPGPVENIDRLYVYVAGQAPTEFPLDADARTPPPLPRRPPPRVRRKGPQDVRVAAGRFRADLIEVGSSRVWRSDGVPLWGLVRALEPGREVELVAFGQTGARTVFPPEFDQGNGSESKK